MLSVVKGALEGEWSDDDSDVILTAMENLIEGMSVEYTWLFHSVSQLDEREREREREATERHVFFAFLFMSISFHFQLLPIRLALSSSPLSLK